MSTCISIFYLIVFWMLVRHILMDMKEIYEYARIFRDITSTIMLLLEAFFMGVFLFLAYIVIRLCLIG